MLIIQHKTNYFTISLVEYLPSGKFFFQCLKAAYEAGEIESDRNLKELAKFIWSSWEGSILQAKVTKSVLSLETFFVFVKILFEQILAISDLS